MALEPGSRPSPGLDDNPDEVNFVLIPGWFEELKPKMGAGR